MSVSHLLELKPKKVKIVENGMIAEADVEKIMPGEAIIVGTGEFIPLDGVIRGGSGNLDTSIVTGRTIHKYVTAGDSVVAGCINKGETLTLEVTKDVYKRQG